MKDIELVESFYTRVIGLINQMKFYGDNIDDKRIVEKVLRSIPPKFESLIVTFEENKYLSKFTVDEFQSSLINHEHRIGRSNTSLEGAFVAHPSIIRGRGTRISNSRCRGRCFSKHSNIPEIVVVRGQNINPTHPSHHKFDK